MNSLAARAGLPRSKVAQASHGRLTEQTARVLALLARQVLDQVAEAARYWARWELSG